MEEPESQQRSLGLMEEKFITTMDKDVRECQIWKLEEQRTSEWKVSCKVG